MNNKKLSIIAIFIVWRILDFLIIFFSQKFVPYLGFFPYANQLPRFHLPTWISALANFDGLHYISIARQGYGQYEQAFFPLYPVLIKWFAPLLSDNQLLTGLIISEFSFLIGLVFLFKLFENKMLNTKYWILIFLLAFPTSFFFGAVYTEGLFFLLFVLALFFIKKKNYWLAAVFVFLASLTRLIGLFLLIPIVFHLIKEHLPKQDYSWQIKLKNFLYLIFDIKYLILIISPILGLFIYCFYLFKTTGDPFFFLTSQPVFGANRSSHLIILPQVYWRYIKIFVTASHNVQYFISVIEFLIFNFVFIILIFDLLKNLGIRNYKLEIKNYSLLALSIFSIFNIILPTLTGTFSSIPRYSLFSISFFIYLADIKNNVIKYGVLILFIIFHVMLLGLFTQGYFIS